MPEPRPLVAIERQSGSVSDICLSGEASNAFSIAASRFTSSSSFASFSLSRVLVSSTVSDRLFSCGSLAVGGVELAHVARHALFDLLLAAPDLALREVVVATVHGLELTAVDGNAGFRQQAHLAAQGDKARANLLDRGTIVLAEVGDGFVIRNEPPGQPHHLQIAASLTLQPPARLDPIEIAVDVKLEHRRRMIRRPAGRCRIDAVKPEVAEVQRIDEDIDSTNRMALIDPTLN